MNNAIVQIFIPAKGWKDQDRLNWQSNEVLNLSNILVRNYAKKYSAEYILIKEPKINFRHPTWERFRLFDDFWSNSFDHILYLDTDVFTWPDSPNIFEKLKDDSLNIVTHSGNKFVNNQPMFNAGVFAINKKIIKSMKKYISLKYWEQNFLTDPNWEDSKELNKIAQNEDVKKNWLEKKWNMKNSPDAYFTHLWGGQKKFNPNMPAIIKAREIVSKF